MREATEMTPVSTMFMVTGLAAHRASYFALRPGGAAGAFAFGVFGVFAGVFDAGAGEAERAGVLLRRRSAGGITQYS